MKESHQRTSLKTIKKEPANTFKRGKALLSIEEALNIIETYIQPLENFEEEIASEMSLGRRLAEDIYAHEDLPKFRKSTMDGYALSESSLKAGSSYEIVSQSEMGTRFNGNLKTGQAVYVPTGAELPKETQAVVKVEGCQVINEQLEIIKPEDVGPHWILKGEDVSQGQKALSKGSVIGPMSLGFLSLLGKEKIRVKKKLKIAILTTGDELIPSFDFAPEGKIRDINQVVLKALALQNECEVVYLKQLPDVKDLLREAILTAVESADLAITCGASSMGKMDVMPELLEELSDAGLIFHGLNMKPGKPVGLAKLSEKPVLALPGNPVSSAMTFVVIGEQVIGRLQNREIKRLVKKGTLEISCASQEGKTTFIPVKFRQQEEEIRVVPNIGKSGLISIIADADGFIRVNPDQVLAAGSEVEVTLF